MKGPNDEWLTVKEVASLLKVKPSTVWRWVREGKIPYYRFSRRKNVRFLKSEIMEWCEQKREEGFS